MTRRQLPADRSRPESNRTLRAGAVEASAQLPAASRTEGRTAGAEPRAAGQLGEVTYEDAQGTIGLDGTVGARLTPATTAVVPAPVMIAAGPTGWWPGGQATSDELRITNYE
ncbi:hypothetical protein [Streptomyces sp. NBC_01451]|uniref:hypothetical protein n=1 Tax=Streptomyces sp. NBC_01451 TaxID=2903872 RepID=UPI002E2F1786|nr:hypothetical protein [Streptomyces sp. NBC_01451]